MSRLDRTFARMREAALADPLTRANRTVVAEVDLPGGFAVALSFNL